MGDAQFNGTPAEWDALVKKNQEEELKEIRIQVLQELADRAWEGCHGCDETDKYMWTSGFIQGYLSAQSEE